VPQQTDPEHPREATLETPRRSAAPVRTRAERPALDTRDATSVECGTRARVPQQTDPEHPREAALETPPRSAAPVRTRAEHPALDTRDATSVECGTRARVRSRRDPTPSGRPGTNCEFVAL
jgi:hypothetical protein